MFLKRIEMQGFKSFADKTIIEFNDSVTGIVGPNGCGKSNISDAIKWVLGEQSVKSLRGDKMTDFIFAGSENRKAQDMAEVTLVFDNSKHQLSSDNDEIEVTRRIYRTSEEESESEYLINRKNVRYKDIVELILDSGLGKDSLSMISQGNITSFAEAKPYDRRTIFEEAAGVSKYKKRKIESLNKLERTKENLDRSFDILQELEKQVGPLKRQAKKAEIYLEKKSKLQEIEVAVLVDDINCLVKEQEDLNKQIFDIESNLAIQQTSIQINENSNSDSKKIIRDYDKEINSIQENLVKTIDEIAKLESRKIELDEKRKYAIEMGSSKEKIEHLKQLVDEAKFEYDDRSNRLKKLNEDITLQNNNLEELALNLADASLKKEETSNLVNRLRNKIEVLENLIRDPFSSNKEQGVKAIMDNKESFYGIMGIVGQEIHPLEGYEEAISTALAGSIYHILSKDEEAARNAINFLKKNKSGRATFLPINILKQRSLRNDDKIVVENLDGYIGTANDYVTCNSEYDIAKNYLLGNVIIADTLENANNIAATIRYAYKIVTLDGEIVHIGGSMSGGKVKNETSIITAQSELNRIKNDVVSYEANKELAIKEYNSLISKKQTLESQITETRIAIASIEPIIETKRSKYEKLKNDYDEIAPNDSSDNSVTISDSVIKELSEKYALRDSLSTSLKIKRDEKMKMSIEVDKRDEQLSSIRKEYNKFNDQIRDLSSTKAICETRLENNINRLASEYQMTYEYAKEHVDLQLKGDEKEEVITLRKEISDLGNVNMQAPEEFKNVNERYEFLKKNYDDLIASRNKILDAIDEMDNIMKSQFKETFDKINAELPKTFKTLFGGGKAELILEDPNDILNTGVDIKCQPPGKEVKSIRLFSGGEKTLIAITVLFTILKVKPIPLVVFDEVEAALDQANVERFAKYVKEFKEDTQFLIITHRPGTMAQCAMLYGITMQHRGVSQLLKVQLVDAIKMAEKDDSKENN